MHEKEIQSFLNEKYPNSTITFVKVIQALWSGYGSLERWKIGEETVVVKLINAQEVKNHPRGWDGDAGHQRKVKSYEIERAFYRRFSKNNHLNFPQILHEFDGETYTIIVLEDLANFGASPSINPTEKEITNTLKWLSNFHAEFLNRNIEGLWEQGSYWHLETRQEELERMNDTELKSHAHSIDQMLQSARFKTLIHGDAKIANFLYNDNQAFAVDFQYVGKGAGIIDVVYFFSSCLSDQEMYDKVEDYLKIYFSFLKEEIKNETVFSKLEAEWRGLYAFAWADFLRFLDGWSPGHWKMGDYASEEKEKALAQLSKSIDIEILLQLAKNAATKAGAYILTEFKKKHEIRVKDESMSAASQVVSEVDIQAQNIILESLKLVVFPNIGLLSEEMDFDQSRFTKPYFWCIDPMDGSLPFLEGKPGFSVAIALLDKTGEPILSVVYDPLNQNMYHAIKNKGAFLNDLFFEIPSPGNSFTLFCDRSLMKSNDRDLIVQELTKESQLEVKLVAEAGAVMNALSVLHHPPAAYIKPTKFQKGGGGLWDFAATVLFYRELGLNPTNYYGEPLDLNPKSTVYFNNQGIRYYWDK
jgi:fructose-1,6-bisphosphatase/inositol monophosphatase family enzyme